MSSRQSWTEEKIKEQILLCINGLGLHRMPSKKEVDTYFGNYALSNKITKGKGFYGWAKELQLPPKRSDTLTGKAGEAIAKAYLEQNGFLVEQMSMRHPYDFLVNGVVKVDVKYSRLYQTGKWGFYSFRLEKKYPTCDVYLLISDSPKGEHTFFVVPSKDVMQTQISIGEYMSSYHRYINRLDILTQYETAIKAVG